MWLGMPTLYNDLYLSGTWLRKFIFAERSWMRRRARRRATLALRRSWPLHSSHSPRQGMCFRFTCMVITGLYARRAKRDAEARAARDDPRAAALAAAAARGAQQAAAAASAAGVAGAAPATLPQQQPGKRTLAALPTLP